MIQSDAGRLSSIFSSDSDCNPMNETCILKIKPTKSRQKKNMFSKIEKPPKLGFDLRRVLVCFYILSRSSIETKAKFIADLYPILRTELEIKDIFKIIVFVALKASPHYAINSLIKD